MSKIKELEKLHNEYVAKQKYLAENSEDPVERKIAKDIYQIITGKETAQSTLNKHKKEELDRWKSYLIKEQIASDSYIVCKGCGYKRYFYKEYGIENHICPECRDEYALINNESLYIPNEVPILERILSIVIGVPLLFYSVSITYLPSIHLILGNPNRGLIFEFTGLSKIPASMALIAITCFVLSYLVDHYDKRHNEIMYKSIRFWSPIIYVLFMGIAVGIENEI